MNTIIFTYASQGLGLVLANHFAAKNWQVIGTGRGGRPAALAAEADYQQFDASDMGACQQFWQSLVLSGDVCLVNNAGGYVSGGLRQTTPSDFAAQMQSNYFAAVYMTRAMVDRAPQARIVNIISTSALSAHAKNSAYGAAKAAAMHFFQSLQQEFKPSEYQITNIYPSDIATHGDNPRAMAPADVAVFVDMMLSAPSTLYAADVTLYPRGN